MSTGGPPPLPPSGPADADWLEASRRGDPVAEEALFHAYSERLIRLIRRRLSRRLSRRFDPEDVVLSAWRSFFLRARAGEFTETGPDGDLWPLLATLTLRKLSKHVRRHQSAGRSVNRDFSLETSPQIIGAMAEAETAALVTDEIEHLLTRLDATDQEILIQTLQGADPAAIAADLDCTDRTIRRSLEKIRKEAAALSNLDVRQPGTTTPYFPEDRAAATFDGLRPTHLESDITLQRLAGQGGFTKVYRAIDRISGETVAVKFLRRDAWRERRTVTSLLKEYETLMSLRDPRIVSVGGWGKTRAGGTFLVLEWIDGADLCLWPNEQHQPIETIAVLRDIAEGLATAHAQGCIHGDLKPANILRRANGEIVLADFGLAWRTGHLADHSGIGGTAGFLAPELLSGSEPSIRSDIYSFGALGRRLLAADRFSPSETPERLHPELLQLLHRCAEESPSNRPAAMNDVITELTDMFRTLGERPRS